MSKTLINVAIDEKSILDDIDSCNIKIQEGSYCLTVDLQLKSDRFWKLCDPTIKWGELRIKVIIGSTIYQFLIEERDTESSRTGLGFSVWGRSKQALLSVPFSKTITDVDVGTRHPWQTKNTDAASIISYVVSNYCPDPPSVVWNTLNFSVYKGSFSANNQSPIDVISSMAAVIGADIVANIDGSLSINAFSIDTDVAVESYNDFDEIVQLDESIDVPSGYNVITVHGYDGATAVSGSGNNSSMSTERQDTGDIYKGRVHVVRLYWVHSGRLTPKTYFHEGTSSPKFKGLESITENVRLVFGHGNTSKPNSEGSTEVTGNEDIPLATKSVTYSTPYTDYNVSADECGDYEVMFYFDDNSATTFYSFTVIEPSSDPDPDDPSSDPAFDPWGICDSMKAEKISPSTVVPGSEVRIRLYGLRWPHTAKWTSGAMDRTCNDTVVQINNEEIVFQDGEANTAYPIDIRGFGGPRVTFNSVKMLPSSVQFANGSTKLIKSSFKGDAEFYSVPAKVTYLTTFNEYKFMVPHSWQSTSISAWFTFTSCEILRLNITVDLSGIETGGTRDVTINFKDHTTDVNLDDVTVMIDGVWRGNTDAEGNLSIPQLAVGDHTIKMTKTGYIDSDLDDLSNDTFTVTMTG